MTWHDEFLNAVHIKPYHVEDAGIIWCADCRDILPHLPKVDLVLTDPPYGVNLGVKKNNQRSFKRKTYADIEDTQDYLENIISYTIPILLDQSSRMVLTPGVKNMWLYPQPSHVGSFYYPCATGCNKWGFSNWQPIFYYGKDPYGGKGSQHDSMMSTESTEQFGHPCTKPIKQWKWLTKRVSLTNEIILDPFLGSGTTAVAAKELGRKFVGIEISEEYCSIAKRRLRQGVLNFED